jgi:hypothetical protein
VHAAVVGRIALRSSASSEITGVRTSTLPVDRFLGLLFCGLLFFAVRLRLILDFFAFRLLAMYTPSCQITPERYHIALTAIAPTWDHRFQRCIGCRFAFNRRFFNRRRFNNLALLDSVLGVEWLSEWQRSVMIWRRQRDPLLWVVAL